MSNESHRQGQQLPPPPWTAGHPDYPPSSQYPATTQPAYQYPPPGMATIQQPVQHPQSDPYRLPHPGPYQRPPEMYAQPPTAPPVPPVVYPAAAPRQRTAIACRYCRRRKIRCSGFDTSQDGRCSNCVRFNQECMFTPVSSQTQAFVPAHAAYPHLRNLQATRLPTRPGEGVMLYGAHGQPLPPQGPIHGQETTLPHPTSLYPPPQVPYGRPGPVPGPPGHPPPMVHPPMLHDPRASQGRRESGTGYEHSDSLPPVSAPTSGANYQSHPAPTTPGPFFSPGQQDTRRLSSHSAYSFDSLNPPPSGANPQAPALPYPTLQPPSQSGSTGRESGPTPPPGQGSATRRSGLSVTDMLVPSEPQNTRSDTDNRMVNALDRRGLSR